MKWKSDRSNLLPLTAMDSGCTTVFGSRIVPLLLLVLGGSGWSGLTAQL